MTEREQFEAWWRDFHTTIFVSQQQYAWLVWQAARAQTAQAVPITPETGNAPLQGASAITSESVPLLSDEEIEATATKAVHEGRLSWVGFKEDADGRYTIPSLSLSHFQLAKVIEQAVLAKVGIVGKEGA